MSSSVRLMVAVPVLLLVGAASSSCGRGPTEFSDSAGLNAVVAASSIALGAEIPVVLQNRSSGDITVGPLDCSAGLERRDPSTGEWQQLASFRSCIQIERKVAEGTDFAFKVQSPDAVGRYRVGFTARRDGADEVQIRSNNFEVK